MMERREVEMRAAAAAVETVISPDGGKRGRKREKEGNFERGWDV